jgi:hypothetical protein
LALHRTQPNPPTRNSSTTYGFFIFLFS